MLLYMFVTVKMIAWRTKFRRGMIETDNQANDRAVNSLMNFETVKYFGMESSEVYHGPIHLFQCSDLIEHHAGELLQGDLACNPAQQRREPTYAHLSGPDPTAGRQHCEI